MNKLRWFLSNFFIVFMGLLLCRLLPGLISLIFGELSLLGFLSVIWNMLLPCAVLAAVITLIWFSCLLIF